MKAEERKVEITHWIGDSGTPTDVEGLQFDTEEEAEDFDVEIQCAIDDFEREIRRLYKAAKPDKTKAAP